MDCAVEVDGSVVIVIISARVGGCTGCTLPNRAVQYSPIREWQILEQLSHGQAPRLLVG